MLNNFNIKGLVDEVVNRRIDLTDAYDDWVKVSFAFASEGSNMSDLFHAVASVSSKYNKTENEKQFKRALKDGKQCCISSFVWMCKDAGIDVAPYYRTDSPDGKSNHVVLETPKPIPTPKPIDFIHSDIIEVMSGCVGRSNLFKFMAKTFGEVETEKVFKEYKVGASKLFRNGNGLATAFPQIDELGRVRQVKVIPYNPNDGKRLKSHHSCDVWDSVHGCYVQSLPNTNKCRFMGKAILNNKDANLKQTLFGMHLISKGNKIGILESEKSALICAILMPSVIWLATGGCNGASWANYDVINPLKGKRVVLYPDSGKVAEWTCKADVIKGYGIAVSVSDICKNKPDNWDVADSLIDEHYKKDMTIGDFLLMAKENNFSLSRCTFGI